jgi:hypothetical protein
LDKSIKNKVGKNFEFYFNIYDEGNIERQFGLDIHYNLSQKLLQKILDANKKT